MPFSWVEFKKDVVKHKVLRARTMSGGFSSDAVGNSDFVLAHPDWAREANTKKFNAMDLKIKNDVEKKQASSLTRRLKLRGK